MPRSVAKFYGWGNLSDPAAMLAADLALVENDGSINGKMDEPSSVHGLNIFLLLPLNAVSHPSRAEMTLRDWPVMGCRVTNEAPDA
ncbi:hypothetical protein [Desulfomonile tiedjei]|uniref:Uncharacterized protein n=1 Tax=Desulfomonile tiedjei (strain ATCC 49306 / DSM 6799 / DCB-1) TaxID=706587 RepID=I4CAV1_DESTA|nr:hypothetical protein [Desulfomonile tiedjei]AFM26692.1 hypothetical protein Desti_4053 [Desulfomonile tiedjei DSM 6799]